MKKIVLNVFIVAAMAGVVWYGYQQKQKQKREMAENPVNGMRPPDMEPTKPVVKLERPLLPPSAFYKATSKENLPVGWEDFYEVSKMDRLDMVTHEWQSRKMMDPEVYEFFKAEMFNRDHWNVTRNNIANALVWARNEQNLHPDPDLHKAFITMLEDETEDPVWRDYCLQFLSMNLQSASDPQRVMNVISRYAKGDGPIAGTAMVHMALQERDAGMVLDDTFGEELAKKLEEPEVHRDTKISILGVMGQRKDIKQLPTIRKYAKQDENANLKRTAIAALGIIGASTETKGSIDDADKALIKSGLKHKNRAVQMAARGALKRLEQ